MRRFSKVLWIGDVPVGGGNPIIVQSMTRSSPADHERCIREIKELADEGARIIRVAVPDREACENLPKIIKASPVPIIADIHFDHRLAIGALRAGVHGLRINPGNIRERDKVREIVKEAKERGVPIRIGVNAGSLPQDIDESLPLHERMVEAAMREIKFLEELSFDLVKISLKAFDIRATVEATRRIAELTPYPIHIGITEAGTPYSGIIRSAIGIGILLYEGIGDTIRVSLTTKDGREEVRAGYEILKSLSLLEEGPVLVSCPSCGRAEVDIVGLAEEVDKYLRGIKKKIKVAVMGCVVNGPGEARDADVGIACGRGKGVIFKKGEILKTVPEGEFFKVLKEEIDKL